jgi:hypothetical protein
MTDTLDDHVDGREVLLAAAADVDRARRQLDLHGDAGLATARACLRVAVARLRPIATRVDVRREVRRSAQRCRSTLSSHLLAAENLEAAGVGTAAVASLLRRATEAFELEPIEHATA